MTYEELKKRYDQLLADVNDLKVVSSETVVKKLADEILTRELPENKN